jgi:hypothetical protein
MPSKMPIAELPSYNAELPSYNAEYKIRARECREIEGDRQTWFFLLFPKILRENRKRGKFLASV